MCFEYHYVQANGLILSIKLIKIQCVKSFRIYHKELVSVGLRDVQGYILNLGSSNGIRNRDPEYRQGVKSSRYPVYMYQYLSTYTLLGAP